MFQSDSIALHVASRRSKEEAARLLISIGSDVNAKDGVSIVMKHYTLVTCSVFKVGKLFC